MTSAAAAFVRDQVAPHVDAWERERAAPFAAARALSTEALSGDVDAAGRLELARALGRAGSLGTAVTLLHAAVARRLVARRNPSAEGVGCVAWPREGDAVRVLRVPATGELWLDGALRVVANVPGADWVLVPLERRAGAGIDALAMIPLSASGVAVTARRAVGLHAAALGEVRLVGCRVAPSDVVAAKADALAAALAEERLLLSTAIVAAADEVLRQTLAFAGTREFGPDQVLGDRQAVRHTLADLLADAEIAGAFARDCADAWLAASLSSARAASLAIVAVDAGQRVAEGCMQLMGARGFMADHPASRLYRDLASVGLLAACDPAALARIAAAELRAEADADAIAPVLAAGGSIR